MAEHATKQATPDEMMEGVSGIVSQEKLNEIRKQIKGDAPGKTNEPKPDEKTGEPKKPDAGAAPDKPDAQTQRTDSKGQPIVVDTPFGKQKYGNAPDMDEVKLSSFEDVKAFAKDHYDMDIKDVNDFQTIFSKLKEVSTQAAEVDKYKTAATNLESTFNNLPEEIGLLVNAYVTGSDYKSLLQKMSQGQSFDYGKSFEAYPELDMINHYTGKSLTAKEYNEMEPDARKPLKDVAEAKYEAERTSYLTTKENTERSTEMRRQSILNSVESSINDLKSKYPEMGDSQLQRVRQIMVSGLRDSLYDSDGVYKQDAATKIAMQEFGADAIASQAKTIGEIVARIRSSSESDAAEKYVMRSDKPEDVSRQSAQSRENLIAEEVKRQTSFLRKR